MFAHVPNPMNPDVYDETIADYQAMICRSMGIPAATIRRSSSWSVDLTLDIDGSTRYRFFVWVSPSPHVTALKFSTIPIRGKLSKCQIGMIGRHLCEILSDPSLDNGTST